MNLQVLEDFRDWMQSPARDFARGIALARARRVSLNALARLHPEKAWTWLIPLSERTGLPPEVVALLAEPVEAIGDWQPYAVCKSGTLPFSMYYEATLAGADAPEYALPVGNLVDAGNPKGIPLHGYRLDGIALYDTPLDFTGAETPEPQEDEGGVANAPVESQTGTPDSLPFLTRPTDNRNEGWRTAIYMRTEWNGWSNNQSESAAYNQWRTVNDLLIKNSKGRYQILVTVSPVIDMKTHAAAYGYSPDISTYDVNGLRAAVKDVAARQYGYNMADYGHKIIYWQNGPGTFGGLASLPGGDISLKTTSTSTAYHELGHNMQFYHSSFLKDQDAEDNYAGNIELGTQEEYGNPFDHMGHWSTVGGNASFDESHFCAAAARKWNWLHADEIYAYREPGTFRIHAYDNDTLQQDRRYAIEFARTDGKTYYVSYYQNISKSPNADAHRNGARLEVMGLPGGVNKPTLIDATYWSKHERQDACIPIGWTFQDQEEGVFITPLARAGDRSWMEVHVHQGFNPANRPPTISSFTATTVAPGVNGTVTFTMNATDPDGDTLAYHWYFDDDNWHRNLNGPSQSFSWNSAGYRSVLCTVTDLKGGVATGRILVTVGTPTTYYIAGGVVDKWGNAVGSVPVDNGKPMTNDGDSLIAGLRSTLTDVNGIYVLTGLANGDYDPATRVHGDTGDRLGGSNPVTVSGASVPGINFVLRVADLVASATSIAEDNGTATVTLQRDPSFSGSINVPVRSVGKAILGTDFTLTPAPDANGEYNLPAGQSALAITVTGKPDTATEGPEDIILAFELNRVLSLPKPVQATLWINDAETPLPRVRLAPVGRFVPENSGTEQIRVTRYGSTNTPLVVSLTTSDAAVHGTDYFVVGGLTQVIPAGAETLDITLQGLNDNETEGREKIQINLGNGSYVKDSQNGATLFVADDDIAVVSIAPVDNLATEADPSNTAVFRVWRTGDLQDALRVEYNALGTALHGTDYQALGGDLTIPVGQAYVDVPIVAIADSFNDEGETVLLWLSSSEADHHLGAYNATASIILGTLPPDPSPEPTVADLFFDTFRRLDNDDADAESGGMSGSFLGTMGAGATYYEGHPDPVALPEMTRVQSTRLRLANGPQMSESGLMRNFADATVAAAGGFSVEMQIAGINSTSTDTVNRFAGFGVGLTQAEAAGGQDIGTAGSFRGRATGTPVIGTADCFVELDLDGNVKVWRYGAPLATVPVGTNAGTLTAGFECTGFTTGSPVTVSVYFNGLPVDINPGNPNSVTQTFQWQNNNANYIGLSCRATEYVEVDYLAIRQLPLHHALVAQRAFALGLTGANASPTADADQDGDNNFVEWAKGTDLSVSNAPAPLIAAVSATNNVLVFTQRRLANHESSGVGYPLHYSTNLTDWVAFTPIELGTTPLPGNAGYEDATLQVDESITAGRKELFVRGGLLP